MLRYEVLYKCSGKRGTRFVETVNGDFVDEKKCPIKLRKKFWTFGTATSRANMMKRYKNLKITKVELKEVQWL